VGAVEQPGGATSFSLEPGCRLRMKILKGPECGEPTKERGAQTVRQSSGPLPDRVTLVEEGCHLSGSLSTNTPLVVRGALNGSISAPSLTVTEDGSVEGKVRVGHMISDGVLGGEFEADVIVVAGIVKSHTVVRAKSIEVRRPSGEATGGMFGECVLDIGDAPSREAALTASLSAAARERAASRPQNRPSDPRSASAT